MNSTTKHFHFVAAACLLACLAPLVSAQTRSDAPPVLLLVREEIKTGRMPDHDREAERYAQILAKAKSPYHRLGMTPIAGNENEVMYLWGFGSFAEMEKSVLDIERWATGQFKADFDALTPLGGDDNHVSQRDMVAVLRDDMSYRPKPINVAEMRYMQITTLRVRPGQQPAFAEAARMYTNALRKGKVDDNFAMYQILSGAPEGVYLVLTPMKSLAEMDTYPERRKPFRDALGEDGMNKLQKLASEALNPGDSSLYRFSPRMSYVSREWAMSSPGFWNPQPSTMNAMTQTAEQRRTTARRRQR